MDDISRKIKAIDWAKLQRQAKKVQASTASALKDLVMTDLENKVRAATADTTWGASGADLMQIAQGTFHREDYTLIMSILWQRLASTRWRCVYKGLELLRYLLMHGSSRVLEDARAAQHHIQTLEHYRSIDPETHKDDGENVRLRAAVVVSMIADPSILDEEREKDKALRAKLGVGGPSQGSMGHTGGLSSSDYGYSSGFGNGAGIRNDDPGSGSSRHGYNPYDYGGGVGSSSAYSEGGAYDDEPRGKFTALGKSGAANGSTPETAGNGSLMPSVDDLLGDGTGTASTTERVEPSLNGVAEDDDDFNPRAASSNAGTNASAGALGSATDMLGGLGLSDQTSKQASTGGALDTTKVPMSALVHSLAAQAGAQNTTLTTETGPPTLADTNAPTAVPAPAPTASLASEVTSSAPSPFKSLQAGSTGPQEGGTDATQSQPEPVADQHQTESTSSSGPPPKALGRASDADPFGDLLSTAKDKGVL